MRFPQRWHDHRDLLFGKGVEQFHDANTRCADAIQYGVNRLLVESHDPLLILDCDMIPVRPFDWRIWLEQHPIWGVYENRGPGINYLWNGIILLDPGKVHSLDLFNLNCGQLDNTPVDVGGMLRPFLQANPGQIGEIKRQLDVPSLDGFELVWNTFAHLRSGANWQVREPEEAGARLQRFLNASQDH